MTTTKKRRGPPPTVLVVDDEPVIRTVVRAALADGAYVIVEAEDGDRSLELAREFRPDLVVLDLMLPGRSGFEVIRELRADAELASTRVIVVTSLAEGADPGAAERLGVECCLAKPFSPLELAARAAELLG